MTSTNTSKTFPLNLPEGDPELLLDELQTRLREGRRLFAEVGQILAEIESRGVRELYGYNSLAVFYEHVARVPRAEAQKVTGRALALNSRRTRDGTSTPPVAPLTGAAAATGALAEGGIDRIVKVMRRLPEHVTASARFDAEKVLVDLAGVARPRDVTIAGTDLLAHLDPEGNGSKDPAPKTPRSEFWLRQKRTGRWDMRGDLDPETGARLNALLVPLSHPAPNPEPDDRTPAERRGDAFAEIVDLAEGGPEIPLPRRNSEQVDERPKPTKPVEKPESSRDVAHIRPPRWWARLSRPRTGVKTPLEVDDRTVVQLPDERTAPPPEPKTA
ncbi:DUF222 domain-containing protein [Amycolatopsis umgeniensis]|uniref:DUF222 domain-containing protein n=1 Tax=Amycolatopsis umgeniensis TaxID=336628 RepID=A0A841B0T9_9PSEU|nr:DUF222 domain-containing protein [Amycolatopsis umgeniensis]MBB5852917.1 hypothetical protein [Amycolatopsis umgeniensis]